MGIVCDTPSPKSITRPVVRPETYRTKRARHVHGVHVETLKHDVRHALSVSLGVQRNFREQRVILFRRNPKLAVERVMLDFLHVVPIRVDTVHDNGAQYLYPALDWRLRNHHGGRVRPRGRPLGLAPRSTRTKNGVNTHLSKNT